MLILEEHGSDVWGISLSSTGKLNQFVETGNSHRIHSSHGESKAALACITSAEVFFPVSIVTHKV